jgi:hypothetical protein
MIKTLSKNNNKYKIYKNGFLEAPITNNDFDIVFSSPPFFDLEKYSNFPQDSLTQFNNENDWNEKFFYPSIIKAYNLLSFGGHMILYMGGSCNTMKYMHKLDNIMNYKGIIYFYENKLRAMYVWQKTEKCKTENCKIINKIENNKIDKIRNLNPKLRILEIKINNKKINIIDDSKLLTGTKMRVATKFLKYIIKNNNKIDTFVYSGNYNGFGAVSVAFACYKLGNIKLDISYQEISSFIFAL